MVRRQVFYDGSTSSVFGNGIGNPVGAMDLMKSALLPGQMATFVNYTNYARGLNGLLVDVANPAGTMTAADFQFATWDGISGAGFTAAAAVPTITTIAAGGVNGSTRVKIEFANNAVQNTWLRVTTLANANTGLTSNDVFYFGNAIGDMNVGNVGSPITVRTNATDTSAVRQNQSTAPNSVGINSLFDLNKDGRVNATDTSIVRQNQSNQVIRFFTAPSSLFISPESVPYLSSIATSMSSQSMTASPSTFESKQPSRIGEPPNADRTAARPSSIIDLATTSTDKKRLLTSKSSLSPDSDLSSPIAHIDAYFATL